MGHDSNSEADSVSVESESVTKETSVAVETIRNEKRHKCTFAGCNLAFSRPSRLQRHIRFHTGERCYKCDYPGCTKAYTNTSHLKRHMKTHNEKKTLYQCTVCSLYLSNQHNLKRHYNTFHLGKLTCKKCNETFTKRYQLKIHMLTHDSVTHKCDQCSKSFTNFVKFKRHKASHEQGAKQYPCTVAGCNEVFGKWVLLCAHRKTQHVYDHKCKDCGKIFFSKHHLRIHSQVHVENRTVTPCPFEKCPRVYYFKGNLNHHIRTYHLGVKYECDICKIKIGTKQKLRNHIEKLHMVEKRVKHIKKIQRKKRKDAGMPKRSVVSKLVGANLPPQVEKMVLERKEDIEYLEQFGTVSSDP
ncbi:unnamed protein product [Xylocopa violacea]|uniref:C2H2-type domain-containing protein n=1 Tax=Xylocopa violacea TaxID=135666 RepID=A0ABP1P0J3_XYLVO